MTTTTTREAPSKVTYRTLAGNLTREPELRYSPREVAWASCGLAVNGSRRLDDGSFEELPAEFFELVTFGQAAEHFSASCSKGDRVLAFGKLESEAWTDQEGRPRTTRKLVCEEIGLSLRFADARPENPPPDAVGDEEPL